jgi:hypothetical protein
MIRTPRELNYLYPLNIPEGKSGNYSILKKIIPAGAQLTVTSTCACIMTGKNALKIAYDIPVEFVYLLDENGIWMSNVPAELTDLNGL